MPRHPIFVWMLSLILAGCATLASGGPGAGGRIVYVGEDGNVQVMEPETGWSRALTNDAGPARHYQNPTWAPDGERVAFVSVDPGQTAAIHVAGMNGNPRQVHASTDAVPFYLYWRPQGEHIGFLAQAGPSRRGLDLQLVPAVGGAPVLVGSGQPFYWSWSPDGERLLTHTGGAADQNPELARMTLYEGASLREQALAYAPGFFQAPAVSPDGRFFVVAARGQTGGRVLVSHVPAGDSLVLVSSSGRIQASLTAIEGVAAFDWAPDGRRLALVDGVPTPFGGIVGRLAILDMSAPTAPIRVEVETGGTACFFWAPDGSRLLSLAPRLARGPRRVLLLDVQVVSAADGSVTRLGTVRPAPTFLSSVMPFYDQYQRSSTPWAPDSGSVVLSVLDEHDRPSIVVLDADGSAPPRKLAAGEWPFWSPR